MARLFALWASALLGRLVFPCSLFFSLLFSFLGPPRCPMMSSRSLFLTSQEFVAPIKSVRLLVAHLKSSLGSDAQHPLRLHGHAVERAVLADHATLPLAEPGHRGHDAREGADLGRRAVDLEHVAGREGNGVDAPVVAHEAVLPPRV